MFSGCCTGRSSRYRHRLAPRWSSSWRHSCPRWARWPFCPGWVSSYSASNQSLPQFGHAENGRLNSNFAWQPRQTTVIFMVETFGLFTPLQQQTLLKRETTCKQPSVNLFCVAPLARQSGVGQRVRWQRRLLVVRGGFPSATRSSDEPVKLREMSCPHINGSKN